MSEDAAFLRKFAVQIATALQERVDSSVEQQRQDQPSIGESVEDLYRYLVFDEPLIDHIPNLPVVSSALSRQLLLSPVVSLVSTPTSSYSLSNRLVNGIIYLCNQYTTTVKQTEKESMTGTEKNTRSDIGEDLNRKERPSHPTVQLAMAKLAFCILVDLPLQCCRDNSSSEVNLKKIRHLLGSFKGTTSSSSTRKDYQGEVVTTKSEGLKSKIHNEEKLNTTDQKVHPSDDAQQRGTDEVWAAESDPSDYDYGEDVDGISAAIWQQHEQQLDNDIDWLDPKVLSKPDPNLTLPQIRDAIGSLLQLGTYTLLEPIFCLPQKETSHYVSQLTQLVLVLLQPRKQNNKSTSPSSEDDSLLLGSSMDNVILSPLWILRDAASYHSNNAMRRSATSNYEQSYLKVLQTLLAMDQAYLQDVSRLATGSNEEPDLCLSSIVGLSSLSSWCETQKKPTQMTIGAIIDSINDLEHVVERAHQMYKRNLPNTLIPILDTLSGIYYDRLDINNAATVPYYTGSAIPQTLLNSGFLRQILSLIATVNNENNGEEPVVSELLGFHHALWGLCIAYPKTVGKYVFRYPGSSQIVRSYATHLDSSAPQICVQCILWNVYGWHQCKKSIGSGGGLNVLRKPGSSSTTASPKLTQDECSEVCQKAWSRLCHLVTQALDDSGVNDDASSERVIEEWRRLLVLVSIPYIAEHFKSLVDSSLVNDVSIVISNQLTHNNVRRLESSNEDGNVDDEKDDKPSRKQKIISQAHKLLKKYNLFFQGTVIGSSKTD